MKKFKYPLAIEGIKEQLEALIPKLKELGYVWGNDYSDYGYLVTHYSSVVYCMAFCDKRDNFEVSASNPDLVLTLAAMVDDDKINRGELFYCHTDLIMNDDHSIRGH